MARRWLSLAARHAFDPSNTQSSLKHFGSGELLCRASLMSALRLPGFVPAAKFALTSAVAGARSGQPLVAACGAGVLGVARRVVEPQFVAGESLEAALATAEDLRSRLGVGAIVDHSVEDAVDLESNRARKVDLVAGVPRGAMVPLKATALADVGMLRELSGAIFAADDPDAARVRGRSLAKALDGRGEYEAAADFLEALARAAADRGVALLLDAERTPIQPAVDALAVDVMRRFPGAARPALYNTYQSYLLGSEARLALDAAACRDAGAPFGAKVVRGAYLADERPTGKLRPSKAATDAAYDATVAGCVEAAARGDACFLLCATHNPDSARAAVRAVDDAGLDRDDPRVAFAQILGMCDTLTTELATAGCRVHKLVLFGAFDDVAPWIARRLDENKDALGAPTAENALLWRELGRRLLGGASSS